MASILNFKTVQIERSVDSAAGRPPTIHHENPRDH